MKVSHGDVENGTMRRVHTLPVVEHNITTTMVINVKKERRNSHVLGLSRFMAFDAFVFSGQILLAYHPGITDLGFGTPVQLKEAYGIL